MSGSSLMFRRLAERSERYPFGDLPTWAKRAVLIAIARSFGDAVGSGMSFADENDLTAVLVDGLNELRRKGTATPAFNASVFQVVSRDGCTSTFDGSSLMKRPDMIFRLAGALDEYEGWFAECKIVDGDHPPGLYVRNGVHRFEAGDYAWAMPSALMIAYAGAGYSLDGVPALHGSSQPSTLLADPQAHETAHERTWTYPGTSQGPGRIRLVHLWLRGATFA
ncbi:hypothetical protein L6R53_02760 [Myxococcota bacterium]|nr:hypothetical protein [Myxococcota bacterium]